MTARRYGGIRISETRRVAIIQIKMFRLAGNLFTPSRKAPEWQLLSRMVLKLRDEGEK